MADVTVQIELGGNYGIKLQDHAWELNIHASPAELGTLSGIQDAIWAEGRSLQAGTCAGAPVWWCAQDREVTIMVGADDQVWDVAVTVPLSTVHDILRLAEEELRVRHLRGLTRRRSAPWRRSTLRIHGFSGSARTKTP
jgi:hypothetical protein